MSACPVVVCLLPVPTIHESFAGTRKGGHRRGALVVSSISSSVVVTIIVIIIAEDGFRAGGHGSVEKNALKADAFGIGQFAWWVRESVGLKRVK